MINKLFSMMITGSLVLSSCTTSVRPEGSKVLLVPAPVSLETNREAFTITSETTIGVPGELVATAELFSNQVEAFTSVRPMPAGSTSGEFRLEIDETMEREEEYRLTVTPHEVVISGKTEKGVFYGTQTFLQLLPSDGKDRTQVEVPSVEIHDYPRFSWRGIHLDEARHFFGAEFVKSLLDQMARLKFNVFHWHLIDDQGFRIEIRQYPKLTEIGAWRLDNENGSWNYSVVRPGPGDPVYGGYYTQEEIREIVAYAAERHITIVPEVEMPGHATSMIWAYPELSCKGELWSVEEGAGFEFSDPLCAGNEQTFEILEGILAEVIELFPSRYIHIGGDECKKDPWRECPKCQRRMKTEQLENVHELQSYFIKRIEKYVRSKDRFIIGWDEILEGGLAPEAAVMSWRGYSGGISAAEMGHEVVMSPTSFCYFDYYQGNPRYEPKAIGGNLPLSKVYRFDPVPRELGQEKQHLILGGQANVWTEHIFTPEQCEYMIFPRAFAMAEVLWTPKELLSYSDFLERIIPRYTALANMGVNFRLPLGEGLGERELFDGQIKVELFNPFTDDAAKLHYTLDGSTPDHTSPVYDAPVQITETTCLKSRIIYNDYTSNIAVTWFFKFDPERNGLHCDYYEGEWTMLPDFDALTPVRSFTVSDISGAPPTDVSDHYALRFRGYLEIEADGEYTFYTSSDDGSRLLIDNQVVIDYDGLHGAEIRTQTLELQKGMHPLEIQFFEGTGGEYLEVGTVSDEGERNPLYPSRLWLPSSPPG